MRSTFAVSLVAFASHYVVPATAAPLGPALLYTGQPIPRLARSVTSNLRSKALIINHGGLCSWGENNGTSFGKSGFCHWSDDAAIGSSCTFERTVEHTRSARGYGDRSAARQRCLFRRSLTGCSTNRLRKVTGRRFRPAPFTFC